MLERKVLPKWFWYATQWGLLQEKRICSLGSFVTSCLLPVHWTPLRKGFSVQEAKRKSPGSSPYRKWWLNLTSIHSPFIYHADKGCDCLQLPNDNKLSDIFYIFMRSWKWEFSLYQRTPNFFLKVIIHITLHQIMFFLEELKNKILCRKSTVF